MANPTTIELPRLENESSRAYSARVEYVTMGVQRSLEALSQKSTKNIQLFKRWSVEHEWVESARRYDSEQALLAAQQHTARYLADLEDHRKRSSEAGKALYSVAAKLLQRLNEQAGRTAKRIKGEDGHWYDIPGMELKAGDLATVRGAFQTSLDLEAHALQLDLLIPKLGTDDAD